MSCFGSNTHRPSLQPAHFDQALTNLQRWDFPSKQNPAHKNSALVARVRELWEKNTSQKDMLRQLNEEGFDIKERELMRVRAKNRWLLRVANGMKGAISDDTDAVMRELERGIMVSVMQADL